MKKDTDTLQALKQLKNIMQKCKDKRVYARVTHVSNTGMSRDIHFIAITKRGSVYNIDGLIHRITGYQWARVGSGLHVGGCGMDMIFHVLYTVNTIAKSYHVVKTSKNMTSHDLYYNGLVNSNY